jgi:DNA modification methylase
LYHGKAEELLSNIPHGSIASVVTDPPYGLGLETWDTLLDMSLVARECMRIGATFLACFGQYPTLSDWFTAISSEGWRYRDHVVWVKRTLSPGGYERCLQRTHESILIFTSIQTGKALYHDVQGPYEDVKLPGVLFGLHDLQSVSRYVSDLKRKAEGLPTLTRRGDWGSCARTALRAVGRVDTKSVHDRSRPDKNYSNVWSFLPPNHRKRDGNYRHMAEKPLALMDRLVRLVAPPGGVILDPFIGSGTTGEACVGAGRKCIGIDVNSDYLDLTAKRVESALQLLRME